MAKRASRLGSVVMLLVTGACGGGGGKSSPPPSPYTLLDPYNASYCAKLNECCTGDELRSIGASYSGQAGSADCTQLYVVSTDVGAAIDAGRVRVNQARAAACAAALDAATCDQLGGLVSPDCAPGAIFEPLQDIDQPCDSSVECKSGWCNTVYNHTCQDPANADVCVTTLDCPDDRRCVDFVCVARLAKGVSCSSDYECQSNHCGPAKLCAVPPPLCSGRTTSDGGSPG